LGTRGADVFCATITGLSPARVYELQVAGHIADKNWGRWSTKVTANTEDGGKEEIYFDDESFTQQRRWHLV